MQIRCASVGQCVALLLKYGFTSSTLVMGAGDSKIYSCFPQWRVNIKYEKNMRVWNMSCGCMRASTVRCRVLDRCGDSLGVEISFKDMCILAAVLTVDAEVSLGRIYEQVCA